MQKGFNKNMATHLDSLQQRGSRRHVRSTRQTVNQRPFGHVNAANQRIGRRQTGEAFEQLVAGRRKLATCVCNCHWNCSAASLRLQRWPVDLDRSRQRVHHWEFLKIFTFLYNKLFLHFINKEIIKCISQNRVISLWRTS